ncbi:meiosis inhibitor protein 1-like [Ostrea edulis]|uniref:meiosis inhibitor protein 1-like n=1 Tax=Ostrea edulis TaxID=37623 RepID=UPI0024AF5E99|nr:meiosis inhibitor protein 1-like [Ostrea edulis]
MESAESSFASSAVEVFLKLINKMNSKDLLENVLDRIKKKMFQTENYKELLPLVVLMGRLVKTFPPLSEILCHEYEPLLHCLVNGLSCVDEEVQSNIVFMFVYVLVGPWEAIIPVNVQHSLAQEVVCLLHTAKAPYLLRNLMALLNSLISSAEVTHLLMTLDFNNVTLLTSLKKLIISKNADVQRSALYVLSCILSRENEDYCRAVLNSDIIEFMFEALHSQSTDQLKFVLDCVEPLCQSDLFYSKCHAVYGMESVLYALENVLERKNFELCRAAFDILATLLTRQPNNIPLFINNPTVASCLQLIGQGIQEHHPEVFFSSMQALCAVIKKSHLLLPIPFEDLERILSVMINRLLKTDMTPGQISIRDRKAGFTCFAHSDLKDPIEVVILIYVACIQLLGECWDDPLTCATSYVSPDSQPKETSLQQFKEFIVNSCMENVIPLAMGNVNRGGHLVTFRQLQRLLLDLYNTDNARSIQVLVQMTSDGLLSNIINRRQEGHEMIEIENTFLLQLCQVLHEDDAPDLPFPDWMNNSILNIKYNLEEYQQMMTQHLNEGTRDLYIFLIYHMCRLDDIPLSGQEILVTVSSYVESIYDQSQLSPLTKRHLVFLWAFSASLLQNNLEKKCDPALSLVLRTVTDEPPGVWYTHHSAFLYWMFLDSQVCKKAGPQIIECWLNNIAVAQEKFSDDFLEKLGETHDLFEMFANAEFTEAFMMTLLSDSKETASLSYLILKNFLEKIIESEVSENFIECVRAKGRQLLLEEFLRENPGLHDDHLTNIMSIFLMTYNVFPPTVDGQDMRLFYHVSKWLCESSLENYQMTEMFLRLIILYIETSDSLNSSVLPMIMQNQNLLMRLEQLMQWEEDGVAGLAFCVAAYLMDFSAQSTQATPPSFVKMKVTLFPLEKRLKASSPIMQQCYLQFLATSFQYKFVSSVIKYTTVGRCTSDFNCPLVSADITCLFCYLQQFMVQECVKTKQVALYCLQALVAYLSTVDLELYHELLTHPWNTAMLEVMVQMTEDDAMSISTTFDMLNFILCEKVGRRILTESLELMMTLTLFLKEQKAKSLVNLLHDQCIHLIEKFLQVVPIQYKQQINAAIETENA